MKKSIFLSIAVLLFMTQAVISSAQTFETFLNAGASTVQAGLDVYHTLDQGYLRTGLSGIYSNHDDAKLRMLELHASISDEILIEGLNGELGIKGLLGSVKEGSRDSDLGSFAFMMGAAYRLPRDIFPITTKIFTEITWTPHPLAFIDMDRYFEIRTGIDFFLVEKAAIEFSYNHYNMKLEADPRNWDYEDDIVMIGVKLRF